MKLVECVPNFSEGRDHKILDAIAQVIKSVPGCNLLDVDPGADTNRTVFTFVGSPKAVAEGAFVAVKKAAELIDMSKHTGAHPRMGATDVCPFIPVSGITMEECAELARQVGKRIGQELGIPVYLYENAASVPQRRNLADVRTGEYEALPDKMKDDFWKPDFGPQVFNARSGATAVGAREFLVAYNINLNTRDKAKAHDLALTIRESGRPARDEQGRLLKDANGEKVIVPGLFSYCKAVGWYIESYHRAQISINLTNYKITPPHLVLEKVRELAAAKGIQVTGSELVGLTPKQALIEAGKYYLKRMGETAGLPERAIIATAVQSMGLDDLAPFDIDKKVIDYAVAEKGLVDLTLTGFADELSSDSPAPGGGSVAALCASLSGALSAMVANLTTGKKGYEAVDAEVKVLAEEAQLVKEKALAGIDADTRAFYDMMDAMRLPKKTEEEIALRNARVEEATKEAVLTPLATLRTANEAVKLAAQIARIGNKNALSDAGTAAACAAAAATAAFLNVKINLPGISDEVFKKDVLAEATTAHDQVLALANQTVDGVINGL